MSLDKILSPDSIVNRCEQVLQKKLNDKTIKLGVIAQDSDKTIYSIQSGNGAIQFIDEEISHREVIVPYVQPADQEVFWLGFSIVLKKVSKSHLALFHIGLRIFQGQISNIDKKKIFRAEWMIDDETRHAQPHWHIHKSYTEKSVKQEVRFNEGDLVLEFGNESTSDNQQPEKVDKLKKIHFAMSSRWHKNEPHHNKIADITELTNWLNGCVDYIANQLNYII